MKIQLYNKSLNSDFWNENKTLKPEIRIALLKIAYTFYKDSKLDINIKDILFLGSLANYNYSAKSDIDLHLLVDFNELHMPCEKSKEYTKLIAKKWNLDHEVKIKGHKVEIYIQDINEENRSTGVFSLISNKWIKEATPENVVIDKELIKQKYHSWVDKINNTIKTKNVDSLKKLMKDLVDVRDAGLSKNGEFSNENLVFKILRNTNKIKKLADSISNIENKELSLKENKTENNIAFYQPNFKSRIPIKNLDIFFRQGILPNRNGIIWLRPNTSLSLYLFKNNQDISENMLVVQLPANLNILNIQNKKDLANKLNLEWWEIDNTDDPKIEKVLVDGLKKYKYDGFNRKDFPEMAIIVSTPLKVIGKFSDYISQNPIKDAFDPSSLGVNRVVMGDPTDDFYRKHNHTMKKLE